MNEYHMDICGNSFPDRWNIMCKGPEAEGESRRVWVTDEGDRDLEEDDYPLNNG